MKPNESKSTNQAQQDRRRKKEEKWRKERKETEKRATRKKKMKEYENKEREKEVPKEYAQLYRLNVTFFSFRKTTSVLKPKRIVFCLCPEQ